MTGTTENRVRIVVVEDNPADVELLRLALEDAKLECELTVIDDGGEALQFARGAGQYAGAPGPRANHSGPQPAKERRAGDSGSDARNQTFDNMPIAVLSSSSSPRERARMDGFHIARYITKPLDLR